MTVFLKTSDLARVRAQRLLGEGGQGAVWLGDDGGRPVAIKVYHPHMASREQRDALDRLVERGPPSPHFLWPLAIVEPEGGGGYGYVMPLREPRFRAFEDFMARRITPSMRTLLTVGMQLADAFLKLHSRGLCYRDISFANVFFDPLSGDVRICDNDNVDVTGTAAGAVLGTPRFMAPEVVRRESQPSDQTDRYSLAVLLFYLLFGGHPLDGRREAAIRCLDVPALEKLYGFEPVYIWDPGDDSNRPVPGVHDNPIAFAGVGYPAELRKLFELSFTEGVHLPGRRVRESAWRKALAAAIDVICVCLGCRAENFHAPGPASTGRGARCWRCRQPLVLPPRMRFEGRVVLLNHSTRLHARHVGDSGEDDPVVAEVVPHPQRPGVFGLRNLGREGWTLARPDGSVAEVPPGRAAALEGGNRIHFGRATGTIEA
ncbi:MAG: protein kinase [Myxococcales bacterium]|nr:protein kinase [Myxococcales bacterium]